MLPSGTSGVEWHDFPFLKLDKERSLGVYGKALQRGGVGACWGRGRGRSAALRGTATEALLDNECGAAGRTVGQKTGVRGQNSGQLLLLTSKAAN